MNKFYSITEHKKVLNHEYQLRNLGIETISMILGGSTNGDYLGKRKQSSSKIYRKITSEDYDREFANRLISIKPIYELENILDYHLDNYLTNENNKKEIFIKHLKYVVIPIIDKKTYKKERLSSKKHIVYSYIFEQYPSLIRS